MLSSFGEPGDEPPEEQPERPPARPAVRPPGQRATARPAERHSAQDRKAVDEIIATRDKAR